MISLCIILLVICYAFYKITDLVNYADYSLQESLREYFYAANDTFGG